MPYVRLKTYPEKWDGAKIKEIFDPFGNIIAVKNIKRKTSNGNIKLYRIDFEKVNKVESLQKTLDNMKLIFDTDVEGLSSIGKKIDENISKKIEEVKNVPKTKSELKPKASLIDYSKQNSIPNPSFHFYKDEAYGKGLENMKLENSYSKLFAINRAQTFELTTTYPGLLVGSGYNHPKLKENTDDFQLGFFFDHTTGLPIISGSSIKGLLRSVCEKVDFMESVYEATIPLEIFEDNKTIFYDAFITSTKNSGKKIFGSDYITSHYSDEPNGELKNPNPIKFLKVLPEVTFRFQFKCDDGYINIFKEIILDFGLGAKTNTGYGKFQK